MSIVAVVGLGYVGLPLAIAFGQKHQTIGFDLATEKIEHYRKGTDPTGEVSAVQFAEAQFLTFTDNPKELEGAEYIVVAVPTPVDTAHQPDLRPLIGASRLVGKHMDDGAVVIYESTVYPGATEEVCVPVLEHYSGLKWQQDFHVAYSPERINPGDREHTLTSIVKVVAGDCDETLERVAALYASVIRAGIHKASGIKIAEAAKVIENTQRDLNIALMNELAIIFDKIGIDTLDVLEAAGSKWNFLPFRPGLVGGHCIGVDPYYLTHKAEMLGYHPQVILAGRRINDGMGKHVAEQTIKQLIQAGRPIKGGKISVLGMTFKEDCPDLRNSRVIDLINELRTYGIEVFVHDPIADSAEAAREYGLTLTPWQDLPVADALVVAVAHRQYLNLPLSEYQQKSVKGGCFIDIKSLFNREELSGCGFTVWRL